MRTCLARLVAPVALVLALAVPSWGQALTPPQLVTLGAFIAADPTFSAVPNTIDGAFALKDLLNAPATPTFVVWRTSVTQDEIMTNGMDWTRVDNLSVGKARVWDWMFDNASNAINPARPTIRAGIEAVWAGTAADLAVRAAVYVHCKRAASIAEKLFATGTGTDAAPATLVFEGLVTYQDVIEARR